MSRDELAAFVEHLAADPDLCTALRAALSLDVPPRTLYTVATLAEELEVSDRAIRRAIEAGELTATRRAGRWVMTTDAVRAWATSGTQPKARGPRRSPAITKRSSAEPGGLAEVFALMDAGAKK